MVLVLFSAIHGIKGTSALFITTDEAAAHQLTSSRESDELIEFDNVLISCLCAASSAYLFNDKQSEVSMLVFDPGGVVVDVLSCGERTLFNSSNQLKELLNGSKIAATVSFSLNEYCLYNATTYVPTCSTTVKKLVWKKFIEILHDYWLHIKFGAKELLEYSLVSFLLEGDIALGVGWISCLVVIFYRSLGTTSGEYIKFKCLLSAISKLVMFLQILELLKLVQFICISSCKMPQIAWWNKKSLPLLFLEFSPQLNRDLLLVIHSQRWMIEFGAAQVLKLRKCLQIPFNPGGNYYGASSCPYYHMTWWMKSYNILSAYGGIVLLKTNEVIEVPTGSLLSNAAHVLILLKQGIHQLVEEILKVPFDPGGVASCCFPIPEFPLLPPQFLHENFTKSSLMQPF